MAYFRQPIGFGRAPGPRFSLDSGGKYGDAWGKVNTHLARITIKTDREALQNCLPAGYLLDPEKEPTIVFEIMNMRNLPWLAGRGYNTLGVYISDVHNAEHNLDASFLAVLFENMCDPILTGREELGFPKVFCNIERNEDTYSLSWDGHEFLKMQFKANSDAKADLLAKKPWSTPLTHGFLFHRYMPSVGKPGQADADYTGMMPSAPASPPVLSYRESADATLTIVKSTFEQLPTLHWIVNALAALPVLEVRESFMTDVQGASDCAAAQRVG